MSGCASIYMRVATWLLRNRHEEWARAMRAEFEHVRECERTTWAFGCLAAAIQQRFIPMHGSTLRISRWVLLLELIMCFLPMTLGWFDAVFGSFGVWRLNSSIVERHFLDTPLNTSILGMMIGAAVIGLVGPIGLFLAFRAVVTGVGLRSRTLGIAMITGIASYAVASVILRLVVGPGAFTATASFILLMIALPAAGVAHLMYLATPARPTLAHTTSRST